MKVFVNEDKCIGCGSCVSLTDAKIFDFNDEGKAFAKVEVIEKEEDIEMVKNAMDYCPTAAIIEPTEGENGEAEVKSTDKENA